MMNSIIDTLRDRLGPDHPLRIIEEDNALKIVNATGNLPYSYWMSNEYESMVIRQCDDSVIAAASAVARHLKPIAIATCPPGYVPNDMLLSKIIRSGVGIYYKKGSSYGSLPYVPGSSRMNGVALAVHGLMATEWLQRCSNKTPSTPEALLKMMNEVAFDCTPSTYRHNHGANIMLLSRARPLSKKKPIPWWHVDRKNRVLTANAGEHGYRCGRRLIKAIPAFVNIPFSAIADHFSSMVHYIPGLDVGHQVSSPLLLAMCQDAWSRHGVHVHAEDISGFDDSMGDTMMDAFRAYVTTMYGQDTLTDVYLRAIDINPMLTANLFDRGPTELTVLKRRCGVSSGFRGTTMQGTILNFSATVWSLTRLGIFRNYDEALSMCANLTEVHGKRLSECRWGVLLKGDDTVLFVRGDIPFDRDDYINVRSELGLKTDAEPGPIFLMQYIHLNQRMTGSSYSYCPEKFKGMRTYRTHGLAAKRIGNRLIFVEHPITEPVPARLATLAALVDMQMHPCRDIFYDMMLNMLNSKDSDSGQPWNISRLYAWSVSSAGKEEILEYATRKGRSDAYLKDQIRRAVEGEGGIDVDSQGNIVLSSYASPWLTALIESGLAGAITGAIPSEAYSAIRTHLNLTDSGSGTVSIKLRGITSIPDRTKKLIEQFIPRKLEDE
jgi:hypothetical protein